MSVQMRVFVISSNRSQNVIRMNHLAGSAVSLTWVVPTAQEDEYRRTGARIVVGGGNLIDSRNLAIEMAFDEGCHCVQLSDDLRGLRFTESKMNDECRSLGLANAIWHMWEGVEKHDAHLAGVAPTANAFFYNQPYSTKHFIVGDMMLIRCGSTPRFDPSLTLKEDYDFTLQHLQTYGRVVRCNGVLATFEHRKNAGGAVAYRSPMREQENIAYLKHKWPNRIVDNPRRENEVLLKWR